MSEVARDALSMFTDEEVEQHLHVPARARSGAGIGRSRFRSRSMGRRANTNGREDRARATRCVALLRGINVGKAKRIAMADLRAVIEARLLRRAHAAQQRERRVRCAVPRRRAGSAPRSRRRSSTASASASRVVVVTAEELEAIVAPIRCRRMAVNPSRYLVAFFSRRQPRPPAAESLSAQSWAPEAFAIGRKRRVSLVREWNQRVEARAGFLPRHGRVRHDAQLGDRAQAARSRPATGVDAVKATVSKSRGPRCRDSLCRRRSAGRLRWQRRGTSFCTLRGSAYARASMGELTAGVGSASGCSNESGQRSGR